MDTLNTSLERAKALQMRITDCQRLLIHAHSFANARWLGTCKHPSFVDLETDTSGPHMVNTSTSIAVICRNESVFDRKKIEAYGGLQLDQVCRFYVEQYNPLWVSKGGTEWSPYVSALAVAVLAHVFSSVEAASRNAVMTTYKQLHKILQDEIKKILDFVESWSNGSLEGGQLADYDRIFFAYTALETLDLVIKLPADIVDSFATKDDLARGQRVWRTARERLRLQFFSQMTYSLGQLFQHLDPVSLALSLHCLAMPNRDSLGLPDDVLDKALDTIFSLQQSTGFWDTATPLLGARTGRVGCSSIEIGSCLLRLPRVASRFEDFCPHFDRLFLQLFRDFDASNPGRGWTVDIRRNGNARQTWYGFCVFEFVSLFANRMRDYAAALIVKGFRHQRPKPKRTWDELANYQGYKARVEKTVINPRKKGATSGTGKCALILFGPPGTGKTTFASALAHKLDWGLIEIGPGDFLCGRSRWDF